MERVEFLINRWYSIYFNRRKEERWARFRDELKWIEIEWNRDRLMVN